MLCPDFQLCNVNLPWLKCLRIPLEASRECSVQSLCGCCLWCLKATKLSTLGEVGLAWCLHRLPRAASAHPCFLILPGLLDRWDPLRAKLVSVRLSNPLFVGNFEFICLEDIKKGLRQTHPGFHSSRKDAVSGQELKGLGHGRLVLTLQEWVCFDCHRSPPPPPFLPVELVMVLFTFPWPSLGQQDFYPAQNSLTLV